MMRIRFVALLSACVLLATAAHVRAQNVSNADDNARILAGLEPSANSPLNRLIQDQSFKNHAARFDTAFGRLDGEQLAKVREWSAQNVNSRRQNLYYLFSGPDFLYANAFFPNASTYIFAGLEPVGPIPDLAKLPRGSLGSTLRNMQVSLGSILSVSYFITAHMKTDLNSGPVFGTLPILYVFLARTGHTIRDVTLVNLDEEGNLRLGDGVREKSTARGVRIGFSTRTGELKTLYYFSTSIADERNGQYALFKFCRQHPRGDSFLKSASYLLHRGFFSQARAFLLDQSAQILQDDSGLPLSSFEAGKWFLHPFGSYTGVLNMFEEHYQPRLTELFRRKHAAPIDFGIGYQSRFHDSNLLLAVRNIGASDVATLMPREAARQPDNERTGVLQKPRLPLQSGGAKVEIEKEIY